MSTKPEPVHVLRTVRKLYGLSQQKLATLAGCSLAAIKQIETGRLRPGPDLADRIRMQTGLDPDQLIENSSPETPVDVMGIPLSKETLEWMEEVREESQTRQQVDESLRHFYAVMELLFDASTIKGKLWALRPALRSALNKLIKDFDLKEDFDRLLSTRYDLEDPWSMASLGKSLYSIVNAELLKLKQRHEQAERKREEFYEVKQLKHRKSGRKHESGRNHRRSA